MNDPLNSTRKKLRWRAWHRGTKELDHLLGQFADLHLPKMDEAQLSEFSKFMEEPEPDLMNWLTDISSLPDQLPTFLDEWLSAYRFDPIYKEQ
jgi:antitoxin CptB